MRFDTLSWNEIGVGKRLLSTSGKIEVRADKPVTLWVSQEGVDAIVKTGTEVKATCQPGTEFWITGLKDTKAFYYLPLSRVGAPDGEVFTNFDVLPAPSANEAAIQQLMRRFKIEQAETLKTMRRQAQAQHGPEKLKQDPVREEPAVEIEEGSQEPETEEAAAE